MKAEAIADTAFGAGQYSCYGIVLRRQFTLDPGQMYNLSLTAALSGVLAINDTETDFAKVEASAGITKLVPGEGIVEDLFIDFDVSVPSPEFGSGVTFTSAGSMRTVTSLSFRVPSGTYVLTAVLRAQASTTDGTFTATDAESKFFDSLEVSGEFFAMPVPEPSISLLLGIGLLGFAARWQRMRGNVFII